MVEPTSDKKKRSTLKTIVRSFFGAFAAVAVAVCHTVCRTLRCLHSKDGSCPPEPQAPYTAASAPPLPPYRTPSVYGLCISPSSLKHKDYAAGNVDTAGGDPFIVGDVGSLQSILEDYLEVDRYKVR